METKQEKKAKNSHSTRLSHVLTQVFPSHSEFATEQVHWSLFNDTIKSKVTYNYKSHQTLRKSNPYHSQKKKKSNIS